MRIDGYEVNNGHVIAVFITDKKQNMKEHKYEPARPRGKWIFKHNSSDIWCSNCDENFDEIPQKFLFCPNCGADMRGG